MLQCDLVWPRRTIVWLVYWIILSGLKMSQRTKSKSDVPNLANESQIPYIWKELSNIKILTWISVCGWRRVRKERRRRGRKIFVKFNVNTQRVTCCTLLSEVRFWINIDKSILGRCAKNQNGNLRWHLPWRWGGVETGLECHIPILKNDFC